MTIAVSGDGRDPLVPDTIATASSERAGGRFPWAPVAALSSAVALCRLATRGRTLTGWDSVNFALALDTIDLVHHQPHPPAAFGYILAGRALRVFLGDSNVALVSWNVVMTAVAAMLVFALAWEAFPRAQRTSPWFAWAALAGSPLLWFYASVAEVYASEMTLSLAVAYCCVRARTDGRWAYGIAAALALLGVFRLSGMLLLLPLGVFGVWTARRVSRVRVVSVFVACVALPAALVSACYGADLYLSLLTGHFVRTASPTNLFTVPSGRLLNRHLRDVAYALLSGVGPFDAVALPVLLVIRRPRLVRGWPLWFAAFWGLPQTAFYVLVHMAKFGYALPAVPVLWLTSGYVYGQLRSRPVQALVLAAQTVSGTAFFLLARPASEAATGGTMPYSRKSLVQKAATEYGSVTFATRHTIVEADRALVEVMDGVRTLCGDSHDVVIVGRDGPGANWRRLMYYFPAATTIRLPPDGASQFMVGRDRSFSTTDEVEIEERCRTFWVVPGEMPVMRTLRAETAVHSVTPGEGGLFWTSGRLSVEAQPGRRLLIR